MKVTIETKETTVKPKGLFAKPLNLFEVLTTVNFTEVELAIVNKRGLGETIVYAGPPYTPPGSDMVFQSKMTIQNFVDGPQASRFDTIIKAKNFEQMMKTEILPLVKNQIETSETIEGTSTFEL